MAFPHSGRTERDRDLMWNAAVGSVREVLAQSSLSNSDIAAVSVAGYGSGLYVLDRDGNPVRPGIVSADSCAAALVSEWEERGLTLLVDPLIQQRVWPGQSLALLGWLLRHEPAILEKAHTIRFCKDFLRGRLCGDLSTDPTDAGIAAQTGLLQGTPVVRGAVDVTAAASLW